MGNCLFLLARGWGIDRQVRKKLQIPGGVPGGGMVTGRIEPCIKAPYVFCSVVEYFIFLILLYFLASPYEVNDISVPI